MYQKKSLRRNQEHRHSCSLDIFNHYSRSVNTHMRFNDAAFKNFRVIDFLIVIILSVKGLYEVMISGICYHWGAYEPFC